MKAGPSRDLYLLAVLLLLLTLPGCFSSTRPETSQPSTGPNNDPTLTVVTGLVQEIIVGSPPKNGSNWSVQVTWISSLDNNRDGKLDILRQRPIKANGKGVYEDSIRDGDVGRVEVRPFICGSTDRDCCTQIPPCSNCQVWGPAKSAAVAQGSRAQINLTFSCKR